MCVTRSAAPALTQFFLHLVEYIPYHYSCTDHFSFGFYGGETETNARIMFRKSWIAYWLTVSNNTQYGQQTTLCQR